MELFDPKWNYTRTCNTCAVATESIPARNIASFAIDERTALAERELLAPGFAEELAGTFKVLANDTRLLLVHALVRAGELCVSDLAAELGMAPQAVSNQLQRLADRRIVATRRDRETGSCTGSSIRACPRCWTSGYA